MVLVMSLATHRILVTRTDQLGDVLLTLPAVEYLRHALPDWEVSLLCRENIGQLIDPFLRARHITWTAATTLDPRSVASLWRRQRYRAIVVMQSEPRLLSAAFRAGIKLRVAPRSRPLSWILANAGLRQRRSEGGQSEGAYCLELAALAVKCILGKAPKPEVPSLELPVYAAASAKVQERLSALGIASGSRFAVIHPGMRGSALNLSPHRYAEIAAWLQQRGLRVVLSVGPAEQDSEMGEAIGRVVSLPTMAGLSLPELLEVFRLAELVVAPSTGPLHLAHWAGTKSIGFFSPVRAHRRERWAPWGGSGKSLALSPDVDCPETRDCRGAGCPLYHCMDRAAWQEKAAQHILS